MKLPNGFGSVYKLSGNRRNPYVAKKTKGWEIDPITGKSKVWKRKQSVRQFLADRNTQRERTVFRLYIDHTGSQSILLRELLCELLETFERYRTGVLIMGKSTSRGGFSETKRTANMFSRWIYDTFSRVLTMMS